MTHTVCGGGYAHYSFSTSSRYDGFEVYALPPRTDIAGFVNDGAGRYYTCEEYGKSWHTKSNTCYMEAGSSVVVLNSDDNAISLQGHVRVGGNR